MSREIKFRAWNNNQNRFFHSDWKYGPASFWEQIYNDYQKPKEFGELQQFTGLKDKNGKEIYEGDIVNFHQFTQELGESMGVIEGEKEFVAEIKLEVSGVCLSYGEYLTPYACFYGTHEDSFEITGNTYENPELLETDNESTSS